MNNERATGLISKALERVETKLAPLLAPHMSDRYYGKYRAKLANASATLHGLLDLPPLSMEQSYASAELRQLDPPRSEIRIWDALSQSPVLIVQGPVGCGKSALLWSLLWEFTHKPDPVFIRNLMFKLFGQPVEELAPILVDLSAWGSAQQPLLDAMTHSLAQWGFPGARDWLRRKLQAGECLLLLDGLEGVTRAEQQAELSQTLKDWAHNLWVFTSRPCAESMSWPTMPKRIALLGVADDAIGALVGQYLAASSPAAQGLLSACERSASLTELLRLPLMLAAACRALRANPAESVRLARICDICLEMLLGEWPNARGLGSRYSVHDRLALLRNVAYRMQQKKLAHTNREQIKGWIADQLTADKAAHAQEILDDLTNRVGILIPDPADGQKLGFVAGILQSHLAAQAIMAANAEQRLLQHAEDPWWYDAIVLATGQIADPLPFLHQLEAVVRQEPYKQFLLAACIAELRECQGPLCLRVSESLWAALESDSTALWQPALRALAGIARKPVKDHFTALVRDQAANTRRQAVLAMGRIGQNWAIPSLGAAIADVEPSVRQQAAWALGNIHSPQSIPVLSRALRSRFPGVRQAASASLAKLGSMSEFLKIVGRELISALGEEDSEIAQLAASALLQIGKPAMPQLTDALNDARLRPAQRSLVARVMGALGDESALPLLIEAVLTGTSEDLDSYIQALTGVGVNAVPSILAALVGKDVTTGAGLIAALVRIGAPAVPALIEAIAGNLPEIRNAAVRALEQIGHPAVPSLTHALLHDERFEVRRRALDVLGRIGADSVMPALLSALSDNDPGVRLNAVRFLGSVGDASAVEPLIDILDSDAHLALRRAAITSLSALKDARAVDPLVSTLSEPSQRDLTIGALTELGSVAVEPLIQHLYAPETSLEVRDAIWDVLRNLGSRARPEDQTLLGLANVFGQLDDAHLTVADILALTEKTRWWTHGVELHQSLATSSALASITDLEKIAGCGVLFDWMTDMNSWLRPVVKDLLWGFKDIVENIKLYLTLNRRDSQRDALLSSIDRLAELEQRTEKYALPFEALCMRQVIKTWRDTLLDAIKELRGRAALQIALLTPRLPLRMGQRTTTAVFRLFNEGDSAARNLSVTLRPAALHGLEIIGGDRRSLEPLGIGEERQVEITIVPRGLREAELALEASYDDDEQNGVTHRFSALISFYAAPTTYTPIESSPYIAGLPVKTADMFFGRQDVFEWVRDNISGTHGLNPLVLYGERRMGKTSVLYQLQRNPPSPLHICLLFDLQLFSYINAVFELLFEMASAIAERLAVEGIPCDAPDWEQFEANPYRAFRAFNSHLEQKLGERSVVVMIDEFGVLMIKVRDRLFDPSIFDFLRGITQSSGKLTFLFTGAYEVRRMQQDYDSILFNMAKTRKISYLEPGEANDLIEKPVQGLLSYHPLVVQKIRAVTACHPYFIQYICDELVQVARSERKNYVELSDLDYVIKDVVQDATGNIENSIYNYLGDAEKLTLAALANATDDVRVFVPLTDIISVLERRGLGMPRDDVMQALRALQERDLVTEMRIGQQLRYSFRMGLVRMWLRQNEILLRLSQE